MSPSMLKSGGITDRIADITKTGKATLVKDPKSGKVALVIPKVSDTSYNLDCTFHGYESGVLLYKKNINGAVLEGEASALWNKTEFYTYLNGLKVGIYTESETSDVTLNKGKENKGSEGRESEEKTEKICGGGPETHNYYCSYDGQGNIAQVSNMAGDMPYNLYAYDSYGNQTGNDYSNDSFSSYKGYDKGPFGYKTGVRQYDPETGRFLSPDAFKGYLTDPASQHPYMYCHGNPIKYSDPSGYFGYSDPQGNSGDTDIHQPWSKSPKIKSRLEKFEKEVASNSQRWQSFLKEAEVVEFMNYHGIKAETLNDIITGKEVNVQLYVFPGNYVKAGKLSLPNWGKPITYGQVFSSSRFAVGKILEQYPETKTWETALHEVLHTIQARKGIDEIKHDDLHTGVIKAFQKHFK